MKNIRFYGCLLLLGLVACSRLTNFFSDRIKQFDPLKNVEKIKPDTMFVAEMGTIDFSVIDGKFIYEMGQRDTLWYVYEGDQFLGAFGQAGRGNEEFLNCIYCGQIYRNGDTLGMWINDMMQQEMKLVDITESLKQNKTVIMKKIRSMALSLNSFILNDSSVLAQQYFQHKAVDLVRYNPKNGHRKSVSMYVPMKLDPFTVYLNHMKIRPAGDKIVSAMCYLDQINILSLKDSGRIAATAGKISENSIDAIEYSWKEEPETYYYKGLDVTDDYIFALYLNQPYDDFPDKPQAVYLHVLDWEGNLLKCFQVDEYLTRISLDAENMQLYGFSIIGEKVFRYNLKGLLENPAG